MKLIVHLNDCLLIDELYQHGVDGIVVGTKEFSSRGILKLDIQEINHVVKQVNHRMKVYVLVNQLYHQHQIEKLKDFLEKLNDIKIDGILFQDFGVLNICKCLGVHYQMMYAPDTLNTNHQTLNTLCKLGIDEAFIARELPLDQIQQIVSQTNIPCMVQIHGVQYISYSRRKLVTNYLEYIHQKMDTDYNQNLFIKVKNDETYSHIFEDEFGTHILTRNELCTLGIEMCAEYGYIETMYMDNKYILEVIDSYQNHIPFNQFVLAHPNRYYDRGFLYDGTVYKLEDIRKREEDERS